MTPQPTKYKGNNCGPAQEIKRIKCEDVHFSPQIVELREELMKKFRGDEHQALTILLTDLLKREPADDDIKHLRKEYCNNDPFSYRLFFDKIELGLMKTTVGGKYKGSSFGNYELVMTFEFIPV